MERSLVFAIALLLLSTTARAEGDDFGLWSEVNVEKKIDSHWDVAAGAELRLRDNASEIQRWSAGLDVSYKISKWLKISAGYSLLSDNNYKVSTKQKVADYYGQRHRFNLSLTGSKDFGRLSLSLRERWQYTYRPAKSVWRHYAEGHQFAGQYADFDDDGEPTKHTFDGKAKNVWRNRLQLKYKLTKQWRPYVSAESYTAKALEKMRYSLGTEFRINKQHSFDVKYLFQDIRSNDNDETDSHIIGLGYTYKF